MKHLVCVLMLSGCAGGAGRPDYLAVWRSPNSSVAQRWDPIEHLVPVGKSLREVKAILGAPTTSMIVSTAGDGFGHIPYAIIYKWKNGELGLNFVIPPEHRQDQNWNDYENRQFDSISSIIHAE